MPALLLTGATGMVGREILLRAATDPRFDRVVCLVRPSGGASAQDRLDELLGKIGVPTASRLAAVGGDVAESALGLSDADRSAIRDVTHVIHCAATVSFDHPLDEARRINVEGTRHLLGVCRDLPALVRLDAVSTAYVAGKRDDLVREGDLLHDRGFHNTYEQTKYEAEQLLRAAMSDLPIAVHRPSIVVGDSKTGKTGAWKVLYWPLKVVARGFLPVVPYDPEGRLDIVPVDYVADGVMALSRDPAALGGTFHLCAGPGRDATMEELTARVFARMGRRRPMRVKPVWFRRFVRPLMKLSSKKLAKTLDTGLVYRPYLELRLQFDTSQADVRLKPASISCPKVLDYIDTIVDAAMAADFGKNEKE
jgi:thioester reductase-like protein